MRSGLTIEQAELLQELYERLAYDTRRQYNQFRTEEELELFSQFWWKLQEWCFWWLKKNGMEDSDDLTLARVKILIDSNAMRALTASRTVYTKRHSHIERHSDTHREAHWHTQRGMHAVCEFFVMYYKLHPCKKTLNSGLHILFNVLYVTL